CEVTVLVANDAKIDAVDVAGESLARDGIIERGECGGGQAAGDRFREAGFIDGADGKRQPALQNLVEHASVSRPKPLANPCDELQRLSHGSDLSIEQTRIAQGVVAPDAYDQMAGIAGELLQ